MKERMNKPGREAEYYECLSSGVVACHLCPQECRIPEGGVGRCRGRHNHEGRLWAETYGRVCALQIDPVEKKPLFHFYPGACCLSLATTGCNFSCLNCQNWSISQAAPDEIESRFLLPKDMVSLAESYACRLVAYTYTEPLTYWEYTRDCARVCREAGLKNILVTAGYINERPLADLLPFIDAANVDLKSFSDEIYHRISQGHLNPVLRTLRQMLEAGVWLEITNLVIPGVNDDMEMIRSMCLWLSEHGFAGQPLHFSRFFPQYRMQNRLPTPVETLLQAREIAWDCGMEYVYIGNVALSESEDTVCPDCGVSLIRRKGYQVEAVDFNGHCPSCGRRIPGFWNK